MMPRNGSDPLDDAGFNTERCDGASEGEQHAKGAMEPDSPIPSYMSLLKQEGINSNSKQAVTTRMNITGTPHAWDSMCLSAPEGKACEGSEYSSMISSIDHGSLHAAHEEWHCEDNDTPDHIRHCLKLPSGSICSIGSHHSDVTVTCGQSNSDNSLVVEQQQQNQAHPKGQQWQKQQQKAMQRKHDDEQCRCRRWHQDWRRTPLLQQQVDPSRLITTYGRYHKLHDLNQGAHGVVELALDMKTGEQVAIKFIRRGHNMKTTHILREVLNQRLCAHHPHIVHLREAFLTPTHLGIAMEYATSGDLLNYVQSHIAYGMQVSEDNARLLFQQLIVAVDFCHRLGIANRDIKLDNILLQGDAPAVLKLCDFGYSKDAVIDSECKTACGTPEYMAPEVLRGGAYDGKATDVWSCGCSLYILLCGYYPFRSRAPPQATSPVKRMQAMLPALCAGKYNPLRPQASDGVRGLLHRMLDPDPETRATVPQIMSHPWFSVDLPPGFRELNDVILARAAAAEAAAAEVAGHAAHVGASAEEMWREHLASSATTQSVADLVALVEAAALPESLDAAQTSFLPCISVYSPPCPHRGT